MQLIRAIPQLTSQDNDFTNDQLCNTSRIGKGAVEDSNTMPRGILEVDLVSPNTETTNNNEIFGRTKDLLIKLGL